jgi:hypothetical protein
MFKFLKVLADMTSPYLEHRVAKEVLVKFIALFNCGCWCCRGKTLEIEMVFVGKRFDIWFIDGTVGSIVTQLMDCGSISSAINGDSCVGIV